MKLLESLDFWAIFYETVNKIKKKLIEKIKEICEEKEKDENNYAYINLLHLFSISFGFSLSLSFKLWREIH